VQTLVHVRAHSAFGAAPTHDSGVVHSFVAAVRQPFPSVVHVATVLPSHTAPFSVQIVALQLHFADPAVPVHFWCVPHAAAAP